MFGCSEHWIGKRFEHALTAFLNEEKRRRELRANDAVDEQVLEERYEGWRVSRAAALKMGGAAAAYALADAVIPAPAAAQMEDAASAWTSTVKPVPLGRVHTVPSTSETVVLGQFVPSRPPIITVDSGDVLLYPNTWTHFLNKLQPGISADELAAMRKANPGKGPHSIIGPVAVRGAMPGDVVQLRMLRLRTIEFGANFHNPGDLHTGVLPDDFPQGHVHYFRLEPDNQFVAFNDKIRLRTGPFQGTLGLAPPGDDSVSSVPPGKYGGNLDIRELTAGASLFVPVIHPGGLIFTGDSHALQADGEVNLTALETGMQELRIQVILHKKAPLQWPFVETATHWIAIGTDRSLNEAMKIALQNTIDFLNRRAQISRDDAYGLASLAVNFRISQMVDVQNGVHAMIPKEIFVEDYRRSITVV
jgi:acetamidase/formamidase